MHTEPEDNLELEDEFEYQDGLGDLLREKERREFSWGKTIVVLLSILTVVALSFVLIFNIGKSLMMKAPDPAFGAKPATNTLSPGATLSLDTGKPLVHGADLKTPAPSEKASPRYRSSEEKAATPKAATKVVKERKKVYPVAEPKKITLPEDMSHSLYRVIVGSFTDYNPAARMVKSLASKGIDSYVWVYNDAGTKLYRVQVGAFSNPNTAESLSKSMKKKGIDAFIIRK